MNHSWFSDKEPVKVTLLDGESIVSKPFLEDLVGTSKICCFDMKKSVFDYIVMKKVNPKSMEGFLYIEPPNFHSWLDMFDSLKRKITSLKYYPHEMKVEILLPDKGKWITGKVTNYSPCDIAKANFISTWKFADNQQYCSALYVKDNGGNEYIIHSPDNIVPQGAKKEEFKTESLDVREKMLNEREKSLNERDSQLLEKERRLQNLMQQDKNVYENFKALMERN